MLKVWPGGNDRPLHQGQFFTRGLYDFTSMWIAVIQKISHFRFRCRS